MKKFYLREAAEEASKSTNFNFHHGAVIILRGKIVARGYNKYCVPSVNKVNPWSIHAEVSAINNALMKIPLNQLRKSTLVVVRLTREGNISNSYPCENCRRYIQSFGIKTTFYSN